jgi:3-methyl-2-oxobutanoate hydroxymethyltransferase
LHENRDNTCPLPFSEIAMSIHQEMKRVTIPEIRSRKGAGSIVALTAYTKPMAQMLDSHVDILLVGDSLGMVLYGMDNSLAVTLDMMINHTKAVMRGSTRACVIIDMPFASYQESPGKAFRSCARAVAESGAQGVKIEGGAEMADTVRFLTERGIPVMAHIGLMPQHVNTMGGFKAQGREEDALKKWIGIARKLEEAGAFSMVIEGTVEAVARAVTEAIAIPTIGIGASPACDGQVLVTEDILGLFSDFTPKFAKRYAELGKEVEMVVKTYASEVRNGKFPEMKHCFSVPKSG